MFQLTGEKISLAHRVGLLALWFLLLLASFASGGAASPFYYSLIFVSLWYGLAYGKTILIIASSAAILAGGGMVYAGENHWLPPSFLDSGPLNMWITAIIWTLICGALIFFFLNGLRWMSDQKKRTETDLIDSNNKIAALFDSATDAIMFFDLQGKIIDANRNAQMLLGSQNREELIGRSGLELLFEEDRDQATQEFSRVLAGETSGPFELRIHRHGSIFWGEVSGKVLRSSSGILASIIITLRDIHARKQTEEQLLRSEERFRILSDASFEAIIIHANGLILDVNRTFCEIFGFSRDEAIGQSLVELIIAPESREHVVKEIEKKSETDPGTLCIRKDGTRFPVEARATSITHMGQAARSVVVRDITERKHAKERDQRQIQRLDSLHQIDVAISASLDLRVMLNTFLEQVILQLDADAADILLLNPVLHRLNFAAGRGFFSNALQHTHLDIGRSYAGRSALERRLIRINNLKDTPDAFQNSPQFRKEGFHSYFAFPLIAKGDVKGVLEIFHRAPFTPDPDWLDFLEALSTQAAIAIDNMTMFNELQRSNAELSLAYDTTLEGWSRALDLRDRETEGHTQRVTELTMRLAQMFHMEDRHMIDIRRGALLHDIGKMGIPDSILNKPGPLTDTERAIMRQHSEFALQLLSPITYLRNAVDIPYCHHEHWDGKGYPRGLKGEEIPLPARIFAIIDVWDALMSDRPYRKAWDREQALDYIQDLSGKQFDPRVVRAFITLISSQ